MRPVIKVAHKPMQLAFRDNIENYQPMYENMTLEEEGGITEISANNLNKLIPLIGPINKVECKKGIILFTCETRSYLATGFSYGYGGTGPSGFARLLAKYLPEQNFSGWLKKLSELDMGWSGVLWEQPSK